MARGGLREGCSFTLIQHNIGRRQNYSNVISHPRAHTAKFRRTVYNYLCAQENAGRQLGDVYTLQEVSLPINVYPENHYLDYVYYSPECSGVYMWFRPHGEPVDTFCFLSNRFAVGSNMYQYIYVNTSDGLRYTSGSGSMEQHFHGVAVAYNCKRFEMERRVDEKGVMNSIYNVLMDCLSSNATRKGAIRRIECANKMHIPKARYTPVLILVDRRGVRRGFISFHGKIVSINNGKSYYTASDVYNEMKYHHDPLKIKRQLDKMFPVYLGVDLNIDLHEPENYFDKYNPIKGNNRRKLRDVFIKYVEGYKRSLARQNIEVLPSKSNLKSYTNISNQKKMTSIDYIMYKDKSASDITICRDESYFCQDTPANTLQGLLSQDFDHCPVILRYY